MMWGKWRSAIVVLARRVVQRLRSAYQFIQTEQFSRKMIAVVDVVSDVYAFTQGIGALA